MNSSVICLVTIFYSFDSYAFCVTAMHSVHFGPDQNQPQNYETSYGPVILVHTMRLTGIVMPVITTQPTLYIACTTRKVAACSLVE